MKTGNSPSELSVENRESLLSVLEDRFDAYMKRHAGIEWEHVRARLEKHPDKLQSLYEMEQSGGEPDVVAHDAKSGEYVFFDCSPESPSGRRSLCYDRKALAQRKENKPKNSAMDLAASMGIGILSESEYRALQKLGEFDSKTSSWILTPDDIRSHGGAIFADFRYGSVFVYHNGADSYYASRGFRGSLRV